MSTPVLHLQLPGPATIASLLLASSDGTSSLRSVYPAPRSPGTAALRVNASAHLACQSRDEGSGEERGPHFVDTVHPAVMLQKQYRCNFALHSTPARIHQLGSRSVSVGQGLVPYARRTHVPAGSAVLQRSYPKGAPRPSENDELAHHLDCTAVSVRLVSVGVVGIASRPHHEVQPRSFRTMY